LLPELANRPERPYFSPNGQPLAATR